MQTLVYILSIISYGVWYLVSLLPLRLLYVFSDILYWMMAKVIRYRHRVIHQNLSSSFPDKTEAEIRQLQNGFYHWFCDYLVETIKLMTMSQKQLEKRMQFTGMEQLNEVLNSGRSCAVYLGHYCNWEWITSLPFWVSPHVQCCQLYHPLENKYFDRLFKHVRERQNAVCLPMKESLRHILAYQKNNQTIIIGFIADQVPMWNNIHHWVNFLHHDTPVLTGAERIVKHTDQAAFYGDLTRVRRGYYQCEMKLISLQPSTMADFQITDIYFRMLEQTILRQPELWLWSHNRWKRTRADFDRNWEVIDGKVIRKRNTENTSS